MISLLVPSRGRARDFERMAATAGDVEVIGRIDNDDEDLYPCCHTYIRGPRNALSSLWNECAAIAQGDILMQCADDIRFRTDNWDRLVEDAFGQYPDRIVYVYGRDGIADQRMATHGFMHRRWYEALGYFTWPHFTSDYGDLWNHTIAERLGRLHYIPELYTEHLHPAVGKAEYDQTHLDRLERDKTDRNADRWEAAQPDLEKAIAVLDELLDTPYLR